MRHRLRALMLRMVTGSAVEPWLRRAHERLARGRGARYDRETAAVLRRVVRPTSSCVDVGCYRGSILRHIVTLAPHGRHFAFEPVPEHHRYLAREFPTVHVLGVALADHEGDAVFHHVVGRPARSGLRRVTYPDPRETVREIEVRVDTLDRVIPEDVTLDLVKIDVEGAELQVLRGGLAVLRRCRPVVIFECGAARVASYGARAGDLYDLLTDTLGLHVSLMRRWLDGQPGLGRREFLDLLDAGAEFCFLAYPDWAAVASSRGAEPDA